MHPSMARRSLAVRLAVFSLLTLLASPALGQSTGGRILGRVADPSGAVLANVSVRITNQATGVARETKTNGSDKAGSVSVNGGRGRANNFSVNGGDANDQFVNLPTVQPSPDSIQEFRVLTNTFDAEYGRNSGSVVNVITKSGTNDLHGNVYEF